MTTSAQDQDEAAKAAIVRRFQQVAAAYYNSEQRVKNHQAGIEAETQSQQQLIAMSNDCHAAARLLGFDLVAALAASGPPAAPAPMPPAAPEQQVIAPAKAIWEMVLDLAKAAYPNPVRATALQEEIQRRRGIQLHFKTVGMSLYRLSRQGLMERRGPKDWFFLPQESRTENSGVGAPEQEEFGL